MSGSKLLCLFATFSIVAAVPIVLKGSSPSGETVIAISSSDPNVEKYLTFNFPSNPKSTEDTTYIVNDPTDRTDGFHKTFSTAVAGTNTSTGRSFGSFNPFFFPFFNFPFNFEGFGSSNFRPNWVRGIESFEPMGNGEAKTVTAINDNGHVYGKVNTVTFDSAKSSPSD